MTRTCSSWVRGCAPLALLLMVACAVPAAPPASPIPAPPPAPTAATGLPPIAAIDGPLAVRITHPTADIVLPNSDSVVIYGSVGSGQAQATVNDLPVPVAPNGAFLAFVPRPADGVMRVVARRGESVAEARVAYRAPPAPGASAVPPTVDYPTALHVRVVGGSDTLATGSDAVYGRPTPTGPYRWFLPTGARLMLTGERGDLVRARLDATTEAWFPREAVTQASAPAPGPVLGSPTVVHGPDWSEVRLPVSWAPFRVDADAAGLEVTLHGVAAEARVTRWDDPVIEHVESQPTSADAVRVHIRSRRGIWGYKAYYGADGSLVIRVRQPPTIDAAAPLRGVRIVVDPGHPPGGAMGPTGLSEADANLGIGLRLAAQLRVRGAEVVVTRATAGELGLADRVAMAVNQDAHLIVSVHNNAFPEGVNPFLRHGTSTYYFHPFSMELARSLNEQILGITGIRDLGVISGNLALVRPTWMPSALTESLFMPIPEQESALRDSNFLEALAAAHLRGIEEFLAGWARRTHGVP